MLIRAETVGGVISRVLSLPYHEKDILFIAMGEQCWVEAPQLVEELRKTGRRFFGGVFPGVIWGGRKYENGCVATCLPEAGEPIVIPSVSSGTYNLPELVGAQDLSLVKTAMILVDGLSPNISMLLSRLQRAFGPEVRFIGGGAGSISLRRFPVVFTRDGVFQDAAVVVPLAVECSLGIRHGWKRLAGPFVANRTQGNVLQELNFKEAFSFYRQIVERDSQECLTADRFYQLAMRYPLGIHVENQEDIVRDPLMLNGDGYPVCCGDIPESTVISVLKGDSMDLIHAAERAADDCLSKADGRSVSHALIFDCISRVHFLGGYFEREVDVINSRLALAAGRPEPMGVLTLGEVASYDQAEPRLFNKTTVLSVLLKS